MARHRSFAFILILSLSLAFVNLSCSTLGEFQRAMSNLLRLQFKIDGVSGFSLLGIPLSGKQSIDVTDALKLLPAFKEHRFPASFNLNIAAINPNKGSDTTKPTTATLQHLAWTLLIDSTQTISGDLAAPVTIPGTGQQSIIPLKMNLDLYQFFGQRGYDGLVNLALALGGAQSSPSRIQLRARPTVETGVGPITYPGDITIVDSEFRSQ